MRIKDIISEKDELITLLSSEIEGYREVRKQCLEGTFNVNPFSLQLIEAINKASALRAELQRESNEMFNTVNHLNFCFYEL